MHCLFPTAALSGLLTLLLAAPHALSQQQQQQFTANSWTELTGIAGRINGLAAGSSATITLSAATYSVGSLPVSFTAPGVSITLQAAAGSKAAFNCDGQAGVLKFSAAAERLSLSGLQFADCRGTAVFVDLKSNASTSTTASVVSISDCTFRNVSAPYGALSVQGGLISVTLSSTTFQGCNGVADTASENGFEAPNNADDNYKFNTSYPYADLFYGYRDLQYPTHTYDAHFLQRNWGAHAFYVDVYSVGSVTLSNVHLIGNGNQLQETVILTTSTVRCLGSAPNGSTYAIPALPTLPSCNVTISAANVSSNYATLSAGLYLFCDGSKGQICNLDMQSSIFSNNSMKSNSSMTKYTSNSGWSKAGANFETALVFVGTPNVAEDPTANKQSITINNCSFAGGVTGSAVRVHARAITSADVTITNSSFSNMTSTTENAPAVGIRGGNAVVFSGINVTGVSCLYDAKYVSMRNAKLELNWCTGGIMEVWNMVGQMRADSFVRVIDSKYSNLTIQGTSVLSAVAVMNTGQVNVTGTTFRNITGDSGAGIHVEKSGYRYEMGSFLASNTFDDCRQEIPDEYQAVVAPWPGAAVHVSGIDRGRLWHNTFTNNAAIAAGGAFAAVNMGDTLDVWNCTFANNQAPSTGFPGSARGQNTVGAGGAMVLTNVPYALVRESNFTNNTAYGGNGGAIWVTQGSTLNSIFNIFTDNKAGPQVPMPDRFKLTPYGGAVIADTGATLNMNYCNYSGNLAAAGGAIAAIGGSTLTVDWPWFFDTNIGAYSGMLRTQWPDVYAGYRSRTMYSSVFSGNMAFAGGAVLGLNSHVWLQLFIDVGAFNPPNNSVPIPHNITFIGNKALTGGALSLLDNAQGVYMQYTTFASNTALDSPEFRDGWFALDGMTPDAAVMSAGCGARGNGGAICWKCNDQCANGGAQAMLATNLVDNQAVYGGAVYAAAAASACGSPDACFTIWMTMLTAYGGFWTPTDPAECVDCALQDTQNNLRGNTAVGGAGGAIFMENNGIISIWCKTDNTNPSYASFTRDKYNYGASLANYVPCNDGWENNSAVNGAYGDVLASTPVKFDLIPVLSTSQLALYKSGSYLPVNLGLVDTFGNAIAPAVFNRANLVTVSINDTQVLGSRNAEVGGDPANSLIASKFENIQVISEPGNRTENFLGSAGVIGRILPKQTMNITVRECFINEISVDQGRLCQWCDAGFYNLDTKGDICKPCPENAVCVTNTTCPDSLTCVDRTTWVTEPPSINGIIVPAPGYWNSNPFSEQVNQCLSDAACDYANRQEAITLYQSTLLRGNPVSRFDAELYTSLLCAEGYTGPLCGACLPGYGGNQNSRCTRCRFDAPLNTFIYILVSCITLAIFLFALRSAMVNGVILLYGRVVPLHKQSEAARRLEIDEIAKAAATGLHRPSVDDGSILTTMPPATSFTSPLDAARGRTTSGQPTVQLSTHPASTAGGRPVAEGAEERNIETRSMQSGPNMLRDDSIQIVLGQATTDVPVEDSEWEMLSAMTKILVNYFQIINILRFVGLPNAPIPSAWSGLLAATSLFISGPIDVISVQCSLPDNSTNKAIGMIIVILCIPFCACFTVCCYWVLKSVWTSWRRSWDERRGVRRADASRQLTFGIQIAITLLTAFYNYYQSILQNLMAIFQCNTIDYNTGNELAIEAGLYTGRWWNLDTSVHCFSGEHAVLTYALGVPGLFIFGLLLPAIVSWWLGRNQDRLRTDAEFMATWSFFYQEYKDEYYAWESLVMVKKLLITAALVLLRSASQGLGWSAGVQVLVAEFILAVALVMHLACRPYKHEILHFMESLSQVTIIVSFYLSLYFTYPSPPAGFIVIAGFLIAINIACTVWLAFYIAVEFVDSVLRTVGLDHEDAQGMFLDDLVLVLKPKLFFLARPVARLLVRAHATRVQSRRLAASMRRSLETRASSFKRSMVAGSFARRMSESSRLSGRPGRVGSTRSGMLSKAHGTMGHGPPSGRQPSMSGESVSAAAGSSGLAPTSSVGTPGRVTQSNSLKHDQP